MEEQTLALNLYLFFITSDSTLDLLDAKTLKTEVPASTDVLKQ